MVCWFFRACGSRTRQEAKGAKNGIESEFEHSRQINGQLPEAALGYYREMMKTRILSDRVLCMHERYRSSDYDLQKFEDLWGEHPHSVRILRGPRCLSRPKPFSHRVAMGAMNEYRLEGSMEPLLEDDMDVEDEGVLLDGIALHDALSPS